MKAVVMLSGGIDSATVLAMARGDGLDVFALGIDYGQPHVVELTNARSIADHYGVPFDVLTVPPIEKTNDVVFGGRNLVLAGLGITYAAARGAERVMFGCNMSDWSRFPDCRPLFWTPLRALADAAYGVSLDTPLLHQLKPDVVAIARQLDVPLHLTRSCYAATDEPCGECLACEVRNNALA